MFAHKLSTDAGARNDILCRYAPSGLSVTIKFYDMAKHLNVRGQTATEGGAQNDTLCRYTPSGVSIKFDDAAKQLNVRGQTATEACAQKCHF